MTTRAGAGDAHGTRVNGASSVDARRTGGSVPLPRNYLRACLLLLLAEGESYGYELLEQLPTLDEHRTNPGGMYRALRAMEDEGLLHSWWEHSPTGPSRHTYELTPEGLDRLHDWAASLQQAHAMLDRYLGRYQAQAEPALPTAVEDPS